MLVGFEGRADKLNLIHSEENLHAECGAGATLAKLAVADDRL
jgi:hypothetical protein